MDTQTMWLKLRMNPLFVAAWTAFAGAAGKELYTALQSGSFDWSLKSWEAMATAGATAAILALVHLYLPSPAQTATTQNSQAAVKTVAMLMLCAVATLSLTGCPDWERTTFQSLAASKATIDQAASDYRNKTIPQNQVNYELIQQAQKAQTAAVEAMAAYEGIKAAGGSSSSALQSKQQEVIAALAEIPPLLARLKALYSAAPTAWSAPNLLRLPSYLAPA